MSMNLQQFLLEQSLDRYFPVVPSDINQLDEGLNFDSYIGCDEIMEYIENHLSKFKDLEESFETRIDLRKLYHLLSEGKIEAIPYTCEVIPFDQQKAYSSGDDYYHVKVTVHDNYLKQLEQVNEITSKQYSLVVMCVDFFKTVICDYLVSNEKKWRESNL